MDGVLVDNRDAHIEAFAVICRKYGVPFSRERFMPTFGMTNDQILERLMPEVIKKVDWHKIAAEKEEIYREIFERSLRLRVWSTFSSRLKAKDSKPLSDRREIHPT